MTRALLLSALLCLAACAPSGAPADAAPGRAKTARRAAWNEAIGVVRDSLKSPSTATFPAYPEEDDQIPFDRLWIVRQRRAIDEPPQFTIADRVELGVLGRDVGVEAEFARAAELRARDDCQRRWVVTGFVDAQNGYGAMIRSAFQVQLLKRGLGWDIERCAVDEDCFAVDEDVELPALASTRTPASPPSESGFPPSVLGTEPWPWTVDH